MGGFEKELRFIPDSEDDTDAFAQVATITNTSDRIVRVVAKGLYSLTVETMYTEHGQYKWHQDAVFLGIDELLEMAKVVSAYKAQKEEKERQEDEERRERQKTQET